MARRDPLLSAARVVLVLAMWVTLAGAATSAITMPLVLGAPARVLAWIVEHGHGAPPPSTPAAIATLLGLLFVMALTSFAAQWLLLRLIDSVGQGDPFNPRNARRLARMGWLTLAIQVLAFPANALAGWIEYFSGISGSFFGFSLMGVLLALVLFILARVFRQGATMREELEGTV
jgi:hypothetical protein